MHFKLRICPALVYFSVVGTLVVVMLQSAHVDDVAPGAGSSSTGCRAPRAGPTRTSHRHPVDRGRLGLDLLNWQEALSKHWPALRFGSATVDQQGEEYFFEVQVYLDELDPEAVQVELYAEGQNGGAPFRQSMIRGERLVGSQNGFMYSVQVPATRPAADFTPRLIPQYAGASVPLEASFILWHNLPAWR